MKDIFKGLAKIVGGVVSITLALPLALPIASFMVEQEPIARFYNLMLYYIDKLIGLFM